MGGVQLQEHSLELVGAGSEETRRGSWFIAMRKKRLGGTGVNRSPLMREKAKTFRRRARRLRTESIEGERFVLRNVFYLGSTVQQTQSSERS